MFPVYASVQVTNPDHPRFEQAGTIQSDAFPDGSYVVKFYPDGETEAVLPEDMRGL